MTTPPPEMERENSSPLQDQGSFGFAQKQSQKEYANFH